MQVCTVYVCIQACRRVNIEYKTLWTNEQLIVQDVFLFLALCPGSSMDGWMVGWGILKDHNITACTFYLKTVLSLSHLHQTQLTVPATSALQKARKCHMILFNWQILYYTGRTLSIGLTCLFFLYSFYSCSYFHLCATSDNKCFCCYWSFAAALPALTITRKTY